MSSQYPKPRRTSTVLDPYAHPHVYYGESHTRKHARARTYSAVRTVRSGDDGTLNANTPQNVDRAGRNAPFTEGVSAGRRISHGTFRTRLLLARRTR
jgi:alpha,alpha-trehalase